MANRINIDFEYAIKETALQRYQDETTLINQKINTGVIEGNEYLNFLNVYKNMLKEDYEKIQAISKWLLYEEKINYMVVIASKTICLQIQALIDLNLGLFPFSQKTKLIFIQENIDGCELAQILEILNEKSFAVNVISQYGESIQTLLLFREFKNILEKKVGKNNANKYIYVSTNNNFGKLFNLIQKENYQHFILLDNLTESYLTFTPAILFPLAMAEINIDKFLEGAKEGITKFSLDSLENNAAYQYAVIRKILKNNNYKIENINIFHRNENKLGELFQMYLSQAAIKDKQGLIPLVYNPVTDLKVSSQLMSENPISLFFTNIVVENPKYDCHIENLAQQFDDELNMLSSLTYNGMNKIIRNTIIENNVIIYKIPNIKILITDDSNYSLGYIMAFLHKVSIMSAYLDNVNPFTNTVIKNFNVSLVKKINDTLKRSK